MRIIVIILFLAVTCAAMGACGPQKEKEAAAPTASASGTGPGSTADDAAAASGQMRSSPTATRASLEVSRTREGNGGIIAVAEELTMEFDYSPPQGRCQGSDGKFAARGIDIDDDEAGVSIDYATLVAPDSGTVVGQVLNLEIKKDGYVLWAVNSALTGSIEDVALDTSPEGGITLTVTGIASGYQKNRAPTGIRKPYRLEATCEL